MNLDDMLRLDFLAIMISLLAAVYTILILFYSVGTMGRSARFGQHCFYLVLTLVTTVGALLANNLVLFMLFWGLLGLLLYLMIGLGPPRRAPATAKKAFIIIGASDVLMLLGLALLWRLQGQPLLMDFNMAGVELIVDHELSLGGPMVVVAYLCLAAGAFAKAGAFPLHTWVPDTMTDAPVPVAAYLPAMLDKLLGIYFLYRVSVEMFLLNADLRLVLMALGSVTIITAVSMALIQHDLRRLLGYHAVSQVGYMVLGIGTGSVIGVAGALFHMINNTLYKGCLVLTGGAVERRNGTGDLERMGGYARTMPITFGAFLVGALAISGVPPLNGFASKWMIYQGVFEAGHRGHMLWPLWLIAAMFGSALTLASFMKLLHAVFLGRPDPAGHPAERTQKDVGPAVWGPFWVLAAVCVIFGVAPMALPIRTMIAPAIRQEVHPIGLWQPGLATGLILLALAIGAVTWWLAAGRRTRTVEPFVGGEVLEQHPGMRVSGASFYVTIQRLRFIRAVYERAADQLFDLYHLGQSATFSIHRVLGALHNGSLTRYVTWMLLGAMIVIYFLFV